jgi:transposase InsO family protein
MVEKLQLDYECPHCYNTVKKVMDANGISLASNRPKGLTKADKEAQKSENLLRRDFTAHAPNQKTVTDIKEWIGKDGKVYSSAVFDCFDNLCLGFTTAEHMRKELVIQTFVEASVDHDLQKGIVHSDRGSQYTSAEFRKTLAELGIVQSMNSAAGRCHDNAKCESMWARGKVEIEICYDLKNMSCAQIEAVLHAYYLDYWNNRRICSSIGGVPPIIKRGAYYARLSDAA